MGSIPARCNFSHYLLRFISACSLFIWLHRLILPTERGIAILLIGRIPLKCACQILVAVGIHNTKVYEEDFEDHFLQQSREFYKGEAQRFLEHNSASVYIHRVQVSSLDKGRQT